MKTTLSLITVLLAPAISNASFHMQFDFGSSSDQSPADAWNNVTASLGFFDNPDTMENLITSDGQSTGVSLQSVSYMNGPNWSGTEASTLFPASATGDNLFGHTEPAGGIDSSEPVYLLAGLDPAQVYDFLFYASRIDVTDNRESRYILTGGGSNFVDLNPSNNIDNFVEILNVSPNESGEFLLEITQGPNNDNGFGFTYLGVMTISAVPEPSIWALLAGTAILGLVAWRRRR